MAAQSADDETPLRPAVHPASPASTTTAAASAQIRRPMAPSSRWEIPGWTHRQRIRFSLSPASGRSDNRAGRLGRRAVLPELDEQDVGGGGAGVLARVDLGGEPVG